MDLADIRKKGLRAKPKPAEAEPDRAPRPSEALPEPGPVVPAPAGEERPAAAVETAPRPDAAKAGARDATPEVGLVTFFVGAEGYAVSVEEVQEVVPPVAVVPIPRSSSAIAGLFSLRGIMIPLFKVRSILDLGEETLTTAGKFLVVHRDDFPAAFPIDRLGQVLTVHEGAIKPPPAFLKGIRGEYLRGIIDIQGRVFGILNLARILPSASRAKEKARSAE